MDKRDNYQIQAAQAKQHFLTYDHQMLIGKLKLKSVNTYIYVKFLCQPHRLNRKNGDLERLQDNAWVDANSFEEVMTLLDLVCDSRPDRWLTGRWKSMGTFGLQFHQNLLEERRNPTADRIQDNPEGFVRACQELNGRKISGCDIGYAIELFDGLEIGLQFWFGDDEFYPRIRYLWDENALQYIRYETMYFAVGLLTRRIQERMVQHEV